MLSISSFRVFFAFGATSIWQDYFVSAGKFLIYYWIEYGSVFLSFLVLAILLYQALRNLQNTGFLQILRRVLILFGLLYGISYLLYLDFLIWLLNRMIPPLMITVGIILQPELRRIFISFSNFAILSRNKKSDHYIEPIKAIIQACEILSRVKRGALIVFLREDNLQHIRDTGVRIDSKISSELLVSIFAYDTPLHDGAILMTHSRMDSAACILPIDPEEYNLMTMPSGTRHRAALELARNTDAVVLIVSEENGDTSLAYDGDLYRGIATGKVFQTLIALLGVSSDKKHRNWKRSLWAWCIGFDLTKK